MNSPALHQSFRTARKKPVHAAYTVAVVGLGYVGLPLALLAERRKFRVLGYDTDAEKTALLKRHRAPFLSEEEARQFLKSHMTISTDEKVLDGADAYIICVPTPVDRDHRPDLTPLISASETVGRHLKHGALVVVESTVNPGACETVSLPAIERESGLKAEDDFFFAHCPERINPGDPVWRVRTIPRVIGGLGPESLRRAVALYHRLMEAEIVPMNSIKEAEAVKMVENAFRDVNIAFVNELAMSFAKAGIDIVNVLKGASTKPFAFMPHQPGCGVGGHCIPVDPYYLIRYGRENGFEHRFLLTARQINTAMPQYTVDLLERTLEETMNRPLVGATVSLLGLAYKRDIPDLRESPALEIREELEKRGALVQAFDPFVPEKSTSATVLDALRGADAALIATDHSMFRALPPEVFNSAGIRVVVDGRNCLDKDAYLAKGIVYRGIGR